MIQPRKEQGRKLLGNLKKAGRKLLGNLKKGGRNCLEKQKTGNKSYVKKRTFLLLCIIQKTTCVKNYRKRLFRLKPLKRLEISQNVFITLAIKSLRPAKSAHFGDPAKQMWNPLHIVHLNYNVFCKSNTKHHSSFQLYHTSQTCKKVFSHV